MRDTLYTGTVARTGANGTYVYIPSLGVSPPRTWGPALIMNGVPTLEAGTNVIIGFRYATGQDGPVILGTY